MFVVRLKRPEEDFDFRAFGSRRAAVERFRTAQSLLIDGEIEDCALFEVRVSDPERAVELASQGDATLIEANLEDPLPEAGPAECRQTNPSGGRTH
jgi:hypothetical protein